MPRQVPSVGERLPPADSERGVQERGVRVLAVQRLARPVQRRLPRPVLPAGELSEVPEPLQPVRSQQHC